MRSTTKHVQVAASVVLVGATVLAANPVVTAPPALLAQPEVQLTASSIANIPVNVVNAIASLPANEILAINQFTDALFYSSSWFTWNPRHVEGWDYPDTLKLAGLINVLLPFPAVADSLAQQLNWIAIAELPMNAGCTGIPGPCDDPAALYGGYFQVPLSELFAGYTFGTITNPITWPDGTTDDVPWSNTTVTVDLLEPLRAGWESLTATPTGIETVDLETVVKTIPRLVDALVVSFNPLTPGSVFYGPPYPVPLDSTKFTWFDSILGNEDAAAVESGENAVERTAETGVGESDIKGTDAHDALVAPGPLADRNARFDRTPPIDLTPEIDRTPAVDLTADVATAAPEVTSETDTDTDPGRHRLGTPVRSIIDRVTHSNGAQQAGDDTTSRRGIAGAVRELSDRVNAGVHRATGGSEDRATASTADNDNEPNHSSSATAGDD